MFSNCTNYSLHISQLLREYLVISTVTYVLTTINHCAIAIYACKIITTKSSKLKQSRPSKSPVKVRYKLSMYIYGNPQRPVAQRKSSFHTPLLTAAARPPSSPLFSSSLRVQRLLLSNAFYLGRHYRYLVSCLTAGAKRCVGLVPLSPLSLSLTLRSLTTLLLYLAPEIPFGFSISFCFLFQSKTVQWLSTAFYTASPAFCELLRRIGTFDYTIIPFCSFCSTRPDLSKEPLPIALTA